MQQLQFNADTLTELKEYLEYVPTILPIQPNHQLIAADKIHHALQQMQQNSHLAN